MKNRRNVVIAILLIAVLCVGIGYAALSDTINFTGKISYTPDFQIKWTAVTDAEAKLTVVTVIDPAVGVDSVSVSLDTTGWEINDTYTFTATVKNFSKFDAVNVKVQNKVETALDPYYDVTAEIDQDTLQAEGADDATVTITIKMVGYPVNELTDAEFTFEVYADQKTA